MGPDRRRTPGGPLARLAAVVFLVAACSQNSGTARGVVIDVAGDLTEVMAFTLLVEGEELTFHPVADGDYPYPLSHLREHLRDGSPILVTWERVDGQLRALGLRDA